MLHSWPLRILYCNDFTQSIPLHRGLQALLGRAGGSLGGAESSLKRFKHVLCPEKSWGQGRCFCTAHVRAAVQGQGCSVWC